MPENEDSQRHVVSAKAKSQRIADSHGNRKISKPPPLNLRHQRPSNALPKSQSTSRASSSGSIQKSSRLNASSSNDILTSTQPRASPTMKVPSTTTRNASQGRSLSQQVKSSTIPTTNPRANSVQLPKPAFSTLQQHYTPRKGPLKLPPIPTKRAPQDPDSVTPLINLPFLQAELIQLHLLHRSAHKTQFQWESSARDHFRVRFDDLCTRHIELKEIAHEQQTLLNQLALVEWCQGIPSRQVADKIQTMSRNILDLQELLASEGKYTRVLDVFKTWFEQATRIQSSRMYKRGKDITFVESIGDG
ncbi:MAG: hypothetical protein Q9164_005443, partial [Protoblastenia rupestris]